MEASTNRAPADTEKARRIVAAMRDSVGRRGAAASTFDQVAQEACVSRGLLHYYFGSKERLLAEVVRHDCELRLAALEGRLAAADSVDAIVAALVTQLETFVEGEVSASALLFELFTASRDNEEIRTELGELYRKIRRQVAHVLEGKQREGVVSLRGEPEAVAAVLFALGDGIGLQLLSDPGWDSSEAFATGIATARFLLGA
jgi:AcrR family transcriptional regulator